MSPNSFVGATSGGVGAPLSCTSELVRVQLHAVRRLDHRLGGAAAHAMHVRSQDGCVAVECTRDVDAKASTPCYPSTITATKRSDLRRANCFGQGNQTSMH